MVASYSRRSTPSASLLSHIRAQKISPHANDNHARWNHCYRPLLGIPWLCRRALYALPPSRRARMHGSPCRYCWNTSRKKIGITQRFSIIDQAHNETLKSSCAAPLPKRCVYSATSLSLQRTTYHHTHCNREEYIQIGSWATMTYCWFPHMYVFNACVCNLKPRIHVPSPDHINTEAEYKNRYYNFFAQNLACLPLKPESSYDRQRMQQQCLETSQGLHLVQQSTNHQRLPSFSRYPRNATSNRCLKRVL